MQAQTLTVLAREAPRGGVRLVFCERGYLSLSIWGYCFLQLPTKDALVPALICRSTSQHLPPTVFYSHSIVTMAVFLSLAISEILSAKEWLDLQIWLWGRSMLSKIVLFDRPYTTFYWSANVTIALSCTIFELFDIK